MQKSILTAILILSIQITFSQNVSEISIKENILKSDLVVEAEIVNKQSFWDLNHNNIYTAHELRVITLIKGEVFSNPELLIMGGKVDDIFQIVSDLPNFEVGDVGVFMLQSIQKENKICNNIMYKYFLINRKKSFVKTENKTFKIENINGTPLNFEILNDIKKVTGFTIQSQLVDSKMKSGNVTHEVTGFSPNIITAGTGSILTIYGTGFGNVQGTSKVWFRLADNPNQIFTNNGFKYVTWKDTQIQMVVPANAATGEIFVDINEVRAESKEELTVKFNVSNEYNLPIYLIKTNNKNGYTFQLHNNISNYKGAKEIIERSIKNWICATNVPWEVESTKSVEPGNDGICSILFGELSENGQETLGRASMFLQQTSYNNEPSFVLSEVDIVFSSKENWCFNSNAINYQQIDFESVALHEFGHSMLVGHINDKDNLMHYAISPGEIRVLKSNNEQCGEFVINKSLAFKNGEFQTISVIKTADPDFSVNKDTLYSKNEYNSYQWLINGTNIGNATKRSYVITASGYYSLMVTDKYNCLKTSEGKYVTKSNSSLISFNCPEDIQIDTSMNENQSIYIKVPYPSIQNPENESYILTNTFNSTNDASGLYPIGKTVVTWKLTDKNGNETTCSQNIIVTMKPESVLIMNCPPTIVLSCLDSFPEKYSNFYDFMEAGGFASSSSTFVIDTLFKLESESENVQYCPSKISRTYSIPDYDGNFASCNQEILINDIEPPIVSCPPDIALKNEEKLPEISKNLVEFIGAGGYASDDCSPAFLLDYDFQLDSSDNNLLKRIYSLTDICGNFTTCIQNISIENPTLIEPHFSTQTMNIQTFPNPTNQVFTIQIDGIENSEIQLEIYNSNGKSIKFDEFYSTNASFNERIDLSNQPSGIYIIKVSDGESVQCKTIIIE